TKSVELPNVSVIMSVYNEEAVIKEKMESLLALDYPKDKLVIYIGSDHSDDRTNEILEAYQNSASNLSFHPFKVRRGKPGVVNNLAQVAFDERGQSEEHIFLMTDASVMLEEETLYELVKHFKNKEIMIVDSNMVNIDMKSKGISVLENQYISSEVSLKNLESLVFGKMVGPFGGCYTIRSSHFSMIPDKFLVDDFYITMRAFEKGGKAINEMSAICYEALPDDMQEEYRRKSRISAGNFQNLHTFRNLLYKGNNLSFAFFSHKVLRWLGPFFIIFALVSTLILAISGNNLYQFLFILMIIALVGVPFLDYLLNKWKINILALRAVRYFIVMNIALLEGFFKYIKGVKNNVWQPPKRN
ncbi:MAG: cellulose synthase/poly-beta-1,6-N-acetylglucosamine synthase-like glycosyltransferase, partial [Saprospiraceae bacterium]